MRQAGLKFLRLVAVSTMLAACGGGGGGSAPAAATILPPDPPSVAADINVLMLGNSHSTVSGLHTMLAAMLRAGRPGQTVAVEAAPGYMFLEDRITDQQTLAIFRSRSWQFVVLQAQKYSTSGQFTYSTAGAEQFVRMTRAQGGAAVMFPEWPQKGVDETLRIYDIHKGIAERERACLAPVGQAWDLAAQRAPAMQLHADDGNHSAPAGAFLAAAVLYSTITGLPASGLPYFSQFPVSEADQAFLLKAAAETVAPVAPRAYCT